MNQSDGYYGHPRREMLPFIPAGATRILDVGCGAGRFAAGLKEARRQAGDEVEIWGVEIDPAAAERAESVLDRVLLGDALEMAAGLPESRFDCIVLNDILEHLVDPVALLRALHPVLVPGGMLVASLPNVRYFGNVFDLAVGGRWDYTDEGILDRTHLRFFTRSSMVRLLRDGGYDVVGTTGINPTGSMKFKLVNLLTLGRWSDMRYLQFACQACRREMS